ncbi:MAG: DUF1800 domain-containing protein [Bacteroidota bacterium]
MTGSSNHIKHLYWRAGFGLTPQEWHSRKRWSISKAVDQLFEKAAQDKMLSTKVKNAKLSEVRMKDLSREEKKQLMKEGRQKLRVLRSEWIERMGNSNHSALLEKMCLFWHGHFACTTKGPKLAFQQMQTIRRHALGNFREFVKAIARDASMIRFLNNQQNRKRKPNENFARELMELFTIGRGHYTEQDIKEAARAFTGWSSNLQGAFIFRKRQHDFGTKTFMGRTGAFDGDDIIDRLLERKETAQHICRKIYRYFVSDQVDERRVAALSDFFYRSNYDIRALMRHIFESDWFYNPAHIGTRIKSPAELLAGIIRNLKVEVKDEKAIVFMQHILGQVPFDPPNVAGWPGGRQWIDNSTLMVRLNLVNYLVSGSDVNLRAKDEFEAAQRGKAFRKIQADLDFEPIIQAFEQQNLNDSFKELADYLLMAPPSVSKDFFDPFTIKQSRAAYLKTLSVRLMSLPEYQLC